VSGKPVSLGKTVIWAK